MDKIGGLSDINFKDPEKRVLNGDSILKNIT